jgi:hypothetical protein
MRKVVPILAGAGLAVLLSGCAHRSYAHKGPDEFAVARQAPLVIPPDFTLTPPAPGAARPQDSGTANEALQAMFGGTVQRPAAESAAVDAAGGDAAETGIRSDAGDPGTNVIDKGTTTRDIIAAPQGDGQDARAATPASGAAPAPAPAAAAPAPAPAKTN